MTNQQIINRWNWNPEEIHLLNTVGYEGIAERLAALDDVTFDKLITYFNQWLDGTAPKARLNYWTRKTGITEPMLNIWCTV